MSDIDTKEEDVQEVEKLKADDNMGLSKAETNNLEKREIVADEGSETSLPPNSPAALMNSPKDLWRSS